MMTDIAWIAQFILQTENGWVKCIVGYIVPHIFANETGDRVQHKENTMYCIQQKRSGAGLLLTKTITIKNNFVNGNKAETMYKY